MHIDLPVIIKKQLEKSNIPVTYEEAIRLSSFKSKDPEIYGIKALNMEDYKNISSLSTITSKYIVKNAGDDLIKLLENVTDDTIEKIMYQLSYDSIFKVCSKSTIVQTTCKNPLFWAKYVMGDTYDVADMERKVFQRKYKYIFFGKHESIDSWIDVAYAINYGFYGIKTDGYIILSHIHDDELSEDILKNKYSRDITEINTCISNLYNEINIDNPFLITFNDSNDVQTYLTIVPYGNKQLEFNKNLFNVQISTLKDTFHKPLRTYMPGSELENLLLGINMVDPKFVIENEDYCARAEDELEEALDRAEYYADF